MMYSICSKEGEEAKKLCNQQMMVINAAYKVLKDPRKRAEYDRKRRISGGSGWGASDGRSTDSDRNVGGGGGSSSSSYWSRSYDVWGTSTGSVDENEDGDSDCIIFEISILTVHHRLKVKRQLCEVCL